MRVYEGLWWYVGKMQVYAGICGYVCVYGYMAVYSSTLPLRTFVGLQANLKPSLVNFKRHARYVLVPICIGLRYVFEDPVSVDRTVVLICLLGSLE